MGHGAPQLGVKAPDRLCLAPQPGFYAACSPKWRHIDPLGPNAGPTQCKTPYNPLDRGWELRRGGIPRYWPPTQIQRANLDARTGKQVDRAQNQRKKNTKTAAVRCIDVSVCCIHLNCPLHTFLGVCNRQIGLCNGQLLVFIFFRALGDPAGGRTRGIAP